jgi:heme-degrading monooxygenase HmoA
VFARTTTIEGQADRIDEVVRRIESGVLPVLTQQEGFKGFTVHVNRSSGKVVGTSYWESQQAMEASEEAVSGPRDEAVRSAGAAPAMVVEHFEVAVDTSEDVAAEDSGPAQGAAGQPSADELLEKQPSVEEVLKEQPAAEEVVEEQPSVDEIVDGQPTEPAVTEPEVAEPVAESASESEPGEEKPPP